MQTGFIASVPPPPIDDNLDDCNGPDFHSAEAAVPTPKSKHTVFDNEYVTQLCVEFQSSESVEVYQKICDASSDLIDSVIRVHKFHLCAPFQDIKNSMYSSFRNWIRNIKTTPGSPKAFSYLSSCIRNSALAYVTKEKQHYQRTMYENTHQTPLDAFENTSYNENFDHELREGLREALQNIEIRWADPVIRECTQYFVETIMQGKAQPRRQFVLKTASMAYGAVEDGKYVPMCLDQAKFLLDWAHGAVRAAVLDLYDQPMGPIDCIRASEHFSYLPDIINLIGMSNAQKLMNMMAGITVKFPSLQQIKKFDMVRDVIESIEDDPSPENVHRLAVRHHTSSDSILKMHERICKNLQAGVVTDYPLWPEDSDEPERLTAEPFER